MRMLTAPIVVCALLALLPPVAVAAEPCAPGTPQAYAVEAPAKVAFGRSFRATANETFSGGGWMLYDELIRTFSVAPLDPSKTSVTARTWSYDGREELSQEFGDFRIDWGESPLIFSAAWTQSAGQKYGKIPYQECSASESVVTYGFRGDPARVKPSLLVEALSLDVTCPVTPFYENTEVSTLPIILTINGAGGRSRIQIPEPCGDHFPGHYVAQHWEWWGKEPSGGKRRNLRLLVRPHHLPKSKTLHFKVRQGNVKFGQGRFKAVTFGRPRRVIHEGSDAFVNYCINQTRKIRSHRGRLYCVYPGSESSIVSGLKWRPS